MTNTSGTSSSTYFPTHFGDSRVILRGIGTALITPFCPDMSVDFEALDRLLDIQLSGDVDYLVVMGTTGEAATLSDEEQNSVREYIVRKVSGRLPLVLGVGGNCTARVVEHIHRLSPVLSQHFAAILSVCPYYNKPSQEGIYQHFGAISEASPIPILLYNVPGRTGTNILPETTLRLQAAYPSKIIGIKEASGNIAQIKQLIQDAPADFLVISGDDGIACQLMEAGAAGLISVASNAFARDFHRIVYAHDMPMQERYKEMVRLLFAEGNPSGIKSVLSLQGIISNTLRLPLVANSAAIQEAIRQELEVLKQV